MDKVIAEWHLKQMKKEEKVSESIVDFEKKTVSRDIFNSDNKLKSNIKSYLMKRIEEVIKKLEIDEKRIVSYYIWGSICGKYYNKYTDIDFQVMVKYDSDEEWEKDLEKMREMIPKGYEYDKCADDHPLNFYIQKHDGKEFPPTIDGLYDVKNDKWIKQQEAKINIGDRTCLEIANGWVRKIEADISELKRDLIDLKFLQENKKEIGNLVLKEENYSAYLKSKEDEIIYDLQNISDTFSSIRNIRSQNQIDIAQKFKTIKGEVKVTSENINLFNGIITWKILDSQGLIAFGGDIKTKYSKHKKGDLKIEKLIKELNEKLIPKDLWKH